MVVSVLYRKVEVQVVVRRQEPAGEHKDSKVHHCHYRRRHTMVTTITATATATATIPCILQPGPRVLSSVGLSLPGITRRKRDYLESHTPGGHHLCKDRDCAQLGYPCSTRRILPKLCPVTATPTAKFIAFLSHDRVYTHNTAARSCVTEVIEA